VSLELFPQKVLADEHIFEYVVPVSQAFLGWLEDEGILAGGKRLAEAIAGWDKQIAENAADRGRWGMAKGLGMLAKSHGVDVSDQDAFNRFIEDYNREIRDEGRYESQERDDGDFMPTVAAIVNEDHKVGRNDPCPCGSGKKYKKCRAPIIRSASGICARYVHVRVTRGRKR